MGIQRETVIEFRHFQIIALFKGNKMKLPILTGFMVMVLALLTNVEAKLLTSITSKSFEEGANPIQFNYGVAVSDVDGDGDFEFVVAGYGTNLGAGAPNLVLSYNKKTEKLENLAIDDTESPYYNIRNDKGKAIGVAACDVDGDGREEIFSINTNTYSGASDTGELDKLFRFNDETGKFEDILTKDYNIGVLENLAGRSVACIDRKGDGKYGIYLANYAARSNGVQVGAHTILEMDESRSSGSKIFLKNVGEEAGVQQFSGGRGVTIGPIVSNYSDFFCDNERGSNFLWENDGYGQFNDIAKEVEIPDSNQNGRGVTLSDFNNDGQIDIAYGNWNGPHRLYLQERINNNINGYEDDVQNEKIKFKNIAIGTEYENSTPIRTVIAMDFDNGGNQELFMNNIDYQSRGAPTSVHSVINSANADPTIQNLDVGDAIEVNGHGTGGAVADMDGDGQVELLLSHGESASEPLTMYSVTEGNANNYIRIFVKHKTGAPARGSSVRLFLNDGSSQMRVIDAGSGYLCQMEPVAHFGLGSKVPSSMTIEVRWPDGITRSFDVSNQINKQFTVQHPSVCNGSNFCS